MLQRLWYFSIFSRRSPWRWGRTCFGRCGPSVDTDLLIYFNVISRGVWDSSVKIFCYYRRRWHSPCASLNFWNSSWRFSVALSQVTTWIFVHIEVRESPCIASGRQCSFTSLQTDGDSFWRFHHSCKIQWHFGHYMTNWDSEYSDVLLSSHELWSCLLFWILFLQYFVRISDSLDYFLLHPV